MSTLTGDWQFWKCLRDSSALSKCKRSRKKFRRSYPHSFSLHSTIIGSWDRKDCVCKENVTKTRNGKGENTSGNRDLPPFSLIRDFRKQNTRGNVSKISVNHACYRQIGSKSTNHSHKCDLLTSITRMIDGNFWNVSAGVFFSKVAYQRKRW